METPSAYSSIITPRSRRLRTVGIVLLIAICAMIAYGYFGLMPSLARSLRNNPPSQESVIASQPDGASGSTTRPLTRAERVRKLRVAVALAYWGVCGLLIVAVLLVAWLDFREITRRYATERRAMWNQAANRMEGRDDSS